MIISYTLNEKEILKIYLIGQKIYPNHLDEWYVYHSDLSRYVSDCTVHLCYSIKLMKLFITLSCHWIGCKFVCYWWRESEYPGKTTVLFKYTLHITSVIDTDWIDGNQTILCSQLQQSIRWNRTYKLSYVHSYNSQLDEIEHTNYPMFTATTVN